MWDDVHFSLQHGEGYLKGIRYLSEERGGRNYVEDPYNKGVAMYIFPEDVRPINVEMTVKQATATGRNERLEMSYPSKSAILQILSI